ncbi:MAG: hypothetical protein LQ351_004508 [Letrouitia transgressa]|nr:MAG: hypothetical protein LQ351_004508 [Letrouitia transgressa]
MARVDAMQLPQLDLFTVSTPLKTTQHRPSWPSLPPLTPLQDMIQQTLLCAPITIRQMEDLKNHLHTIQIIHLSNGSRLVLKVSPSPITLVLRRERYSLESEALALQLLAKSSLPLARVLKHDARCLHLGAPFLLTTYLTGVPYAEVQHFMNRSQRADVDRQLRSLTSAISQHTSSMFGPFGPVSLVASNQGHRTWREAFHAMLEAVLMDGEDMMVSLPYLQIREQVSRLGAALDEVKEPRLVVLGLCQPKNVLVDPKTDEVTGLLDFGTSIWGDWEMGSIDGAPGIRGLLYTCLDAITAIVANAYRPQKDASELDARKRLTTVLERLIGRQ